MATPRTAADLLDLIERTFPPTWLDGLRDPGPGWELLQAYAAQWADLSAGIAATENGWYFGTAPFGRRATVSLRLTRADGTLAITVLKGTRFKASRNGHVFVLDADRAFGIGDLGPYTVAATARWEGYEANYALGPRTTLAGATLPGDVDTVDLLFTAPALPGLVFHVEQLADAAGGLDPALGQLGADRGLVHGANEGIDVYRARCRRLPDTVSPAALRRVAQEILAPFGASATMIESFASTYGVLDDVGPSPPSLTNLFCYDDPRPGTPFQNRWQDEREYRGASIFVVPALPVIAEAGAAWSDTCVTPADRASAITGGTRRAPAFGSFAWSGHDSGRSAVYGALWDNLQRARPAASAALLELEGQ